MSYADGYVLPIPKKHLKAYRRMAALGRKVWEARRGGLQRVRG
jgi:uncharacterized protein YbaA (DUF1428 family)